jgi:hypothetical protein
MAGALAGLLGAKVWTGMREAGLRRVDDLVLEAMLHPDIARSLLQKATPQMAPRRWRVRRAARACWQL